MNPLITFALTVPVLAALTALASSVRNHVRNQKLKRQTVMAALRAETEARLLRFLPAPRGCEPGLGGEALAH